MFLCSNIKLVTDTSLTVIKVHKCIGIYKTYSKLKFEKSFFLTIYFKYLVEIICFALSLYS